LLKHEYVAVTANEKWFYYGSEQKDEMDSSRLTKLVRVYKLKLLVMYTVKLHAK